MRIVLIISNSILASSTCLCCILRLIHQHTDIDQIRDDLDEAVIDEESLCVLSEAEKTKRAKKLEISLLAKVRKKSDDSRYVELGERLEKLRERYETGVLSSINWRKELLDAAGETAHLDNGSRYEDKIVCPIK